MRTFIAIDFDDSVERLLAELCDRLRPHCPKLRWVDPRKIHLTLKFLGEIGDAQVAAISQALDRLVEKCHPFDIIVEKVGVFARNGPVRTLWIGIRDDQQQLRRCHDLCDQWLEPLGFVSETRPFHPHLTLARNRSPRHSDQLRRAVESEKDLKAGSQTVTSLTFYQSTRTSGGALYQALSRHPFPT